MVEDMERAAWAGRRAVVAFPERVDGSNVVQVRDELLAVFDRGAAVVIADMSATAWCDGAAVDVVAWACQRAAVHRAELRLVATAPTVRQLLAAEGLDRLIPVYSSMEAAVAAGEPVDPHRSADPARPAAASLWSLWPQAGRGSGSGRASLNAAVLRQLIDALADGVVLADKGGRIMLANRRAAAMFGYQPDELIGEPVESLMPAGLRDGHRLDRAAYVLKPTARAMADRAWLVGLRKDGTTIPITITLSPVPTATDHLVLAVVRDVTSDREQDDLVELIQAVLVEQAHHVEELLDRVVGSLFHVGLSIDTAARQPAEQAREKISQALQGLDDIVHEIRDHVFRSQRPGGRPAW